MHDAEHVDVEKVVAGALVVAPSSGGAGVGFTAALVAVDVVTVSVSVGDTCAYNADVFTSHVADDDACVAACCTVAAVVVEDSASVVTV